MQRTGIVASLLGGALWALAANCVHAEEVAKVGVVGPLSGPLSVIGDAWRQGIEGYFALHGDVSGGRKIEIIYRDDGGDPGKAKQLAQELVVRDKVDFLGGFGTTPEAAAAASVVNQAKIPTFMFHVSSPKLLTLSPYYLRMGANARAIVQTGAAWAINHKLMTAYIAVTDYGPGVATGQYFREYFEAHGGKIIGEDHVPLNTVDFSTFAERIAEAKPDIVNLFILPGSPSVGFMKALSAQGVTKHSVILGQGEAEDTFLHLFDDSIVGYRSPTYYSPWENTGENKAFLAKVQKKFGPSETPSNASVGAYDALKLIAMLLSKQQGAALNGDKEMELLQGYAWEGPRGKVSFDSKTREPIQDFMMREVRKTPEGLRNAITEVIPQVNPATFGTGG